MKAPEINGISVVVPVHNEAGNVDSLVKELLQVEIDSVAFEFVFVDDNSSDNTVEVLLELSHQDSRLRVLEHTSNHGQSATIHSGVKEAKYDWICTMDGDGQNDPSDIPNLVLRAKAVGPDDRTVLISGNRRRARKDSFIRRISSVVANGVRARLLRDSTPDSGCGLRLISQKGYLSLPYFDHMHRFIPSLVLRDGGSVHTIHVNHRTRLEGKSHYGISNRLWVGIVDILGVMWLQRRGSKPRLKKNNL